MGQTKSESDEDQVMCVSDPGWIPAALARINRGEDVAFFISGPVVVDVMRRVQGTAARLPTLKLWQAVKVLVPQAGVIPVDPTMLVPVLAAVGAVGGAVGSMAFVAAVGMSHGMKVALAYHPGAILDPTDDEFVVELTKGA